MESAFTEMMVQIVWLSVEIVFCKTDILSALGMINLLKRKNVYLPQKLNHICI